MDKSKSKYTAKGVHGVAPGDLIVEDDGREEEASAAPPPPPPSFRDIMQEARGPPATAARNMTDEEAFSTFVRLMKSYDLRGHFTPNMPALQLRLFHLVSVVLRLLIQSRIF